MTRYLDFFAQVINSDCSEITQTMQWLMVERVGAGATASPPSLILVAFWYNFTRSILTHQYQKLIKANITKFEGKRASKKRNFLVKHFSKVLKSVTFSMFFSNGSSWCFWRARKIKLVDLKKVDKIFKKGLLNIPTFEERMKYLRLVC